MSGLGLNILILMSLASLSLGQNCPQDFSISDSQGQQAISVDSSNGATLVKRLLVGTASSNIDMGNSVNSLQQQLQALNASLQQLQATLTAVQQQFTTTAASLQQQVTALTSELQTKSIKAVCVNYGNGGTPGQLTTTGSCSQSVCTFNCGLINGGCLPNFGGSTPMFNTFNTTAVLDAATGAFFTRQRGLYRFSVTGATNGNVAEELTVTFLINGVDSINNVAVGSTAVYPSTGAWSVSSAPALSQLIGLDSNVQVRPRFIMRGSSTTLAVQLLFCSEYVAPFP